MSYEIQVENIKCGGCANTITTRLNELDVVNDCDVDIEQGIINISGDESHRAEVTQLLFKLGYPETGSTEGLKAAAAKVKSFVSCATGKMNN